jgi:hypothetical protein
MEISQNPNLVGQIGVTFRFSEPATAELRCDQVGGDDPHLVRSGPPAKVVRLDLHGLLASSTYACTVQADKEAWDASSFTLETEALPEGLPEIHITSPPSADADAGWTLHDHWTVEPENGHLVVFDPQGQIRWYRATLGDRPSIAGVDVSYASGHFVVGGGNAPPAFVDRSANLLYQAEESAHGHHHHHTQLLESGDVLSLTFEDLPRDGVTWTGFTIEVRSPLDDRVVWSWRSGSALEEGALWLPKKDHGGNPWHANSVSFVDDPLGPAAWVSLMSLNTILRIDRETGEVTHHLGWGGDFTLLNQEGEPELDEAQWFSSQHDPEFSWPRVLVYDNGLQRRDAEPRHSRALELELDLEAHTAQIRWEYSEPGWYEPMFGDVDRLPNGHVLLAQGHCVGCPGVQSRSSAIVEINPTTNEVVWRADLGEQHGMYRAERIAGCALFTATRWCDLEQR